MAFDTPIAFFLFNRPQETERTFRRIARVKPRTLLLVADGPRGLGEVQRCDDARAVLRHIDWPCDVRVNFADYNLGCRRRVSSGLHWVFTHVEQAIILEDDCLADESFFPFCAELLEKYRNDPRAMSIAGDNFQFGRKRTPHSYYFSLIPHVWGWATWRRAWRHFDLHMRTWPMLRETDWLRNLVGHASVAAFYRDLFDKGISGTMDTWDIQWVFANLARNGLTILPETNLVTNIGFGPDATHTRSAEARESNMPVEPMRFPLAHPDVVERNVEADEFTYEHGFRLRLTGRRVRAA
jgi:hypothetical protein